VVEVQVVVEAEEVVVVGNKILSLYLFGGFAL
jgi:hypothetical protein